MPKTVIFLTGATGNLGSRVLVRFLQDPKNFFTVLVYAKNIEEATRQVRSVVEFWGESWDRISERITIVTGDITRVDLGLSPSERVSLATEVTDIIHCAANFKLDLSLEEARESIVFGTQHLIAFARQCQSYGNFRRFHYISTEEVGMTLSGKVVEDFLPLRPQSEYFNTYDAKAEAEELLREEFQQDGFPVTIYRPAIIVGDSQSGKIINAQGFYYIIRDMFLRPQSPLIPMNDTFQVDVIPVDFLAEVLYRMHDTEETNGRIYHLSTGKDHFLTLKELLISLQDIHFKLTGQHISLRPFVSPRLISTALSILSLFTWGKLRKTIHFQIDFLQFFFVKAVFETTALDAFLQARNMQTPNLREYLPVLYRYYYENNIELTSLQK